MAKPALDLDSLSREERLELLEEVWDSLSRDPASLPLTDEQEAELDRRLDSLECDGAAGIPGDEIRKRIKNRSS